MYYMNNAVSEREWLSKNPPPEHKLLSIERRVSYNMTPQIIHETLRGSDVNVRRSRSKYQCDAEFSKKDRFIRNGLRWILIHSDLRKSILSKKMPMHEIQERIEKYLTICNDLLSELDMLVLVCISHEISMRLFNHDKTHKKLKNLKDVILSIDTFINGMTRISFKQRIQKIEKYLSKYLDYLEKDTILLFVQENHRCSRKLYAKTH